MEDNEKRNKAVEEKENGSLAGIIIRAALCALFVFVSLMAAIGFYNDYTGTIEAAHKPIIYIYSEKEQEVKVKLLDKDLLTCSYPKYENGWNVIAKPNGDLVDLGTGKQLYSLYYESKNKNSYKMEEDGFCVKREDVVSFLEEKLEILGLNYKEKEEFIVYWLPQLEKYDYVYIRFANEDEISNNMGLEIEPKPETLIRVMMTWKGLEKPIKVNEQKLEETERNGYTIVEWGGTEINE